jgi:hypothetical protein
MKVQEDGDQRRCQRHRDAEPRPFTTHYSVPCQVPQADEFSNQAGFCYEMITLGFIRDLGEIHAPNASSRSLIF